MKIISYKNKQVIESGDIMRISTPDLLGEFFESKKDDSKKESKRSLLNISKICDYERAVNKRLIEMNCEELINLVDMLASKKNKYNVNTLSHQTISDIVLTFGEIFNYYIDKFDPIVNLFTQQKRMKATNILDELCKRYEPFSWDYVEKVLDDVRSIQDEQRTEYYETIMSLYYNGFFNAKEIIQMEENMINHDLKTVDLGNKTVHLSNSCYQLLTRVHNYGFEAYDKRFVWADWQDSYFRYYIRKGSYKNFNDENMEDMVERLTGFISRVNRKVEELFANADDNVSLDSAKLYNLGIYDFMVRKYGLDRTNNILTSKRVKQDVQDLKEVIEVYGVKNKNPTTLKNNLKPYIRNK